MPSDHGEDIPHQAPKDDPKSKKHHDITKPSIFDLTPTVRILIYTAACGVIGLAGNSLLNSLPKPLLFAWTLIFCDFLLVGFVVRLELKNHKLKHRMPDWLPNGFCITIIAVGLGVCLFAVLQEKLEPKPHLKLVLNKVSGEAIKAKLELTNKFLMFPVGDMPSSNILGVIVIPVTAGTSNIGLGFSVFSGPDIDTEAGEIGVHVPKKILFANPDWLQVGEYGGFIVYAKKLPSPLLRTDGQDVPDLPLSVHNKKAWPMRVELAATGMPRFNITFWLLVSSGLNVTKPQVILKTDKLFTTNNIEFKGEIISN